MTFRGDHRGQSVQIGAVLLFAVLLLAFTGYQAVVVPQQNGRAEFDHSQRVAADVADARNAIMAAALEGEERFVDVELGTRYPLRLLALNPPPAAGTLRTTEARPFAVYNDSDGAGTDVTDVACPGPGVTRTLRYEPSYNEYGSAPVSGVEHTVAYRTFAEDTLTASGQRLVRDRTITLVALHGEYAETGAGTVTFEPRPGAARATTVVDPELVLPTELSRSTWVDLLAGEVPAEDVAVANGDLTLSLEGRYTLRCAAVGANQAPAGGERGDVEFGGGDLNPAGPGSVRLANVSSGPDGRAVTLTLENAGDRPRTLERARIPFVYEATKPNEVEYGDLAGNRADRLRAREDFEVVDAEVVVPAGGRTDVTIEFSDNAQGYLVGFSAVYNGTAPHTYVVDVPGYRPGGGGSGQSGNVTG